MLQPSVLRSKEPPRASGSAGSSDGMMLTGTLFTCARAVVFHRPRSTPVIAKNERALPV